MGRFLDDKTRGYHSIGGGKRVAEAQIDFLLRWGRFMMRILNGNAHFLEREHGFAAKVGCVVERRQIEIAALIDGLRRRIALEAEILDRRADVDRIAHRARALQHIHEHMARIARSRRPVRRAQIAEHARHAVVARTPRQHLEGRRVGMHEHIGILQARKPVDGRAIEADAFFKRDFNIGGRNGDVFQIAENIGEPQSQKANVALFDLLDDILLRINHESPLTAVLSKVRLWRKADRSYQE